MRFAPAPNTSNTSATQHKWSALQEAIFEWFEHGTGNLKVAALAGSGKSSTILEGANRAPESNIWIAAYNKHIQKAMEEKLTNPCACAKTLHGVGLACIKRRWGDEAQGPDADRGYQIAEKVLKDISVAVSIPLPQRILDIALPNANTAPASDRAVVQMVAQWVQKLKELVPSTVKLPLAEARKMAEDTAAQFDLLPEEDLEARGWSAARLAAYSVKALEVAAAFEDRRFDFADMIFLPLVNGWCYPKFDMVVADEAQDLSESMLAFVRKMVKANGRIAIIGDKNQCAPPGSMVSCQGWEKRPIESLKDGDKVISFARHEKAIIGWRDGFDVKVSSRHYVGTMITVSVNNTSTRTTPNHRWLVRWSDRSNTDVCVTYMMKRGDRFRIGWCQLFNKIGTFHLAMRARIEGADCAWILKAFVGSDTVNARTEASVYESIVAAKFGLPTIPFNEVDGAQHITTAAIDRIFNALAGEIVNRANYYLSAHGRDIYEPLSPPLGKSYGKMGRTTLFETYASNLEPVLMSVPVPVGETRDIEYVPIDAVERNPYDGVVYSLEVDKHGTYIQDGMITHNSIYQFRGADPGAMDRLGAELQAKELPLTITYRCPVKVVREAQRLVPGITERPGAPDGIVREIQFSKLASEVQPGDLVLSRVNAMLMKSALGALQLGKPVTIIGRELGEALVKLIKKIDASKCSLREFRGSIAEYREEQCAKYGGDTERSAKTKLERILDQVDALEAVTTSLIDSGTGRDTFDLTTQIRKLFTDQDSKRVTSFSTVHRVKGLEANTVFVLRDTLYVYGMRRGDQEEANIEYVAITRAKNELVWVTGAVQKKFDDRIPERSNSDRDGDNFGVDE